MHALLASSSRVCIGIYRPVTDVYPCPPIQSVCARVAAERIMPTATEQPIIVAPALERIMPAPAHQDVVSGLTQQHIVP